MTRDDIVEEARRWIGTPYRHQASRRAEGADCLGLVRGVWRGVIGPEPEAAPPYSPDWAERMGEETLLQAVRRHLVECPAGAANRGDVLLFRMGLGCPAKHCAIVSQAGVRDEDGPAPERIIHAYWGRSVVETRLAPWWRRRIAAAFSFPGLSEAD